MLPQHCLRQLSAAFTAANNHFHLVFFSFGRCAKWILLPTSISFSFHFLRAAQPCLVNLILAFHKIPRYASTPALLALSFISFVPVYFTFLLPRLYFFLSFFTLLFVFSFLAQLSFHSSFSVFSSPVVVVVVPLSSFFWFSYFSLLTQVGFVSRLVPFLFLVYCFPRDIGRLLRSHFNAGRLCLT